MRKLFQISLTLAFVNLYAQSPKEIFDKVYKDIKSARTIMFNATLITSGKRAGKTVDVDGKFGIKKKGLELEKFRHVSLLEVGMVNGVYFEEIVYNGKNFYSYNFEKRRYENKGELYAEFEGKRKTRTAIFFYQDLLDLYREFENKKQSIAFSPDSIGYNLSIPFNREKGQAVLYFEKDNKLPYKVIEYDQPDNRNDYSTLMLSNVKLNVPFPDNYFETPDGKDAVEHRNTTVSIVAPNVTDTKHEELLAIKTVAPEWEAFEKDSVKIKSADFLGKVVVMDFWATWCAPCVRSMPMLQRIHEQYKDVVVIGFNAGENKVDLEEYKVQKNLHYTLVRSTPKINVDYKVNSLPTLYLIDQNGMIAYASLGYSDDDSDTLISMIEMLLKR